MDKSALYRIAQLSIMEDETIPKDTRLDIIAVLMEDEKLARWQEAEKAAEEA